MQSNKILPLIFIFVILLTFNSYSMTEEEAKEIEESMKENGFINTKIDYASAGYDQNYIYNSKKGVSNIHIISSAMVGLIMTGGALRFVTNLLKIAFDSENAGAIHKRNVNLGKFMIMSLSVTGIGTLILTYYR